MLRCVSKYELLDVSTGGLLVFEREAQHVGVPTQTAEVHHRSAGREGSLTRSQVRGKPGGALPLVHYTHRFRRPGVSEGHAHVMEGLGSALRPQQPLVGQVDYFILDGLSVLYIRAHCRHIKPQTQIVAPIHGRMRTFPMHRHVVLAHIIFHFNSFY
jgi:hypothetical protein